MRLITSCRGGVLCRLFDRIFLVQDLLNLGRQVITHILVRNFIVNVGRLHIRFFHPLRQKVSIVAPIAEISVLR